MAPDDKEDDFKQKYNELKKEFERAQKEIERLNREKKELERKNKNLEDQLALVKHQRKLVLPSPNFKPNISGPRRKAGAPMGHKGISRTNPRSEDITHEIVLNPDTCPHCGTHLEEPENGDVRFVFDVQPPQPMVIRVTTKRPYCPTCGIRITPRSPDFFSKKTFGNGLAITISVWRMMGITREKIQFMLKMFYGLNLSKGAIKDMERFVAKELRDEYETIKVLVQGSKCVGGDETSYRIDGKNNWLWVFSTVQEALFVIDKSRGRTVPMEILDENFDGVLVNDGWTGYNSIDHPKQQCLVHINRQMQRSEVKYGIEPHGFMKDRDPVYTRPGRPHEEFVIFERSLRKMMSEAVKFDMSHPSLKDRRLAERSFKIRLCSLIDRNYTDKAVLRLVKFLSRHFEEIFTFVGVPGVPWHNNGAERDLRPSVVIRKNSYGSRSLLSAKAFETLMTLFMTCKKREVNFVNWLQDQLSQRALGVFAART